MALRELLPVNPDGGREPGGGGSEGPPGEGVPTGGVAGDGLVKTSGTDFATTWVDVATQQELDDALAALPAPGGRVGMQVVTVDDSDSTNMTADITPYPDKVSFVLVVPPADPGGTTLAITLPDPTVTAVLVVLLVFSVSGDALLVSPMFNGILEAAETVNVLSREFLCAPVEFPGFGLLWRPVDLIKAGDIDARILVETGRAESAESGLQSAVDANATAISEEASRALFAEGLVANEVADEQARAVAAEGVLATAVADETTRAEGIEVQLATNIDDEATRAVAAEGLLADRVTALEIDGFRSKLVPTGAFTIGSTQSITVTWSTPMPTGVYSVQVADIATALAGNVTIAVTSQDAASATVLVTSSAIIVASSFTLVAIQ